MDATFERDLIEEVSRLPAARQWQVLHFARTLAAPAPQGVPGKTLLSLAGSLPPEDAAEMAAAIEEGCEPVDEAAW